MKLTPSQQKALDKLQDSKWHSAYDLQVSLNTMYALSNRDIVESRHELAEAFINQSY